MKAICKVYIINDAWNIPVIASSSDDLFCIAAENRAVFGLENDDIFDETYSLDYTLVNEENFHMLIEACDGRDNVVYSEPDGAYITIGEDGEVIITYTPSLELD